MPYLLLFHLQNGIRVMMFGDSLDMIPRLRSLKVKSHQARCIQRAERLNLLISDLLFLEVVDLNRLFQ
ncbi:MAG: hypothetical protein ACFC1C_00585 [Candidatus Malihini olakiniferum]